MVELITSRYFDLEEMQWVLREFARGRDGWWLPRPRWRKVVRYAGVEDAPLSAVRALFRG